MMLVTKVLTVLRLFVALSAFAKIDHRAQWDWSTTFWPYWCSFAIQAIMAVASMIILVNTILNYLKDEAIREDCKSETFIMILVFASFWAFVVTFGFVVSTLIPIVDIIQLYDIDPPERGSLKPPEPHH